MTGALRLLAGLIALAAGTALLVRYAREWSRPGPELPTAFVDKALPPDDLARPAKEPGPGGTDAGETYTFPIPSGKPASVTCEDAHMIVRQLRDGLAYVPSAVVASAFATAAADWLDPHGLWSVAPDSPIPAVFDKHAALLVRDLEDPGSACSSARVVGDAMAAWVAALGASFDRARHAAATAPGAPSEAAARLALESAPFEDDPGPAKPLVAALGEDIGREERAIGPSVTPYGDAARARFLPPLDGAEWAEVVLAAAVRAYVQLADLHGEWAPHDEEASVYDVDLDAHPPDRLWERAARTALGVRVESSPMEPLAVGDVVLAIDGVATAGLPLEQLDQLVYATTDADASAPLVIVRRGEHELRTVILPAPGDAPASETPPEPLPAYRVPYGGQDALVVEVHDVRSDLGDELASTILRRQREDRRPIGELLIDLRDDGGGSTDGAMAALALFLPGAPLFPMVRRDGSIEVDRAPEPPLGRRWTGPVATLVDSDTASAAEMIAGALVAYRRGPAVGQPTYGKGCAQEYVDDDAHVGVLRLTTLLYALPDGSPVQGVGIEPTILLPPVGPDSSHEHEADSPNAPPTWRGPDVRDPSRVVPSAMNWPDSRGNVGPCKDAEVCRALVALGAAGPARKATATHSPGAQGPGRR